MMKLCRNYVETMPELCRNYETMSKLCVVFFNNLIYLLGSFSAEAVDGHTTLLVPDELL